MAETATISSLPAHPEATAIALRSAMRVHKINAPEEAVQLRMCDSTGNHRLVALLQYVRPKWLSSQAPPTTSLPRLVDACHAHQELHMHPSRRWLFGEGPMCRSPKLCSMLHSIPSAMRQARLLARGSGCAGMGSHAVLAPTASEEVIAACVSLVFLVGEGDVHEQSAR